MKRAKKRTKLSQFNRDEMELQHSFPFCSGSIPLGQARYINKC